MRLSKEDYERLEGIVKQRRCTECAAIIAQSTRMFVDKLNDFDIPQTESYKIMKFVAIANPYNFEMDVDQQLQAAAALATYIASVWWAHNQLGFAPSVCTDIVCVMF